MERLFFGNLIHPLCNRVDLLDCSLSIEEAEEFVRKNCNDFLKTHKGLSYLCMKYPNLSVPQAIDEYIKEALWIDFIV